MAPRSAVHKTRETQARHTSTPPFHILRPLWPLLGCGSPHGPTSPKSFPTKRPPINKMVLIPILRQQTKPSKGEIKTREHGLGPKRDQLEAEVTSICFNTIVPSFEIELLNKKSTLIRAPDTMIVCYPLIEGFSTLDVSPLLH